MGVEAWTVSSAMLSSTFIWSFPGEADPKPTAFGIPNTGCTTERVLEEEAAAADVNENIEEPEEAPRDEPNAGGVLPAVVDAPNENVVGGDEEENPLPKMEDAAG